MHSAFPRGAAKTAAKKHSQTRPLLWVEKSICRKFVFRSQLLHSHIPHERRWILCMKAIHHSSCLVWKAAGLSLPPQTSAWSCSGTAAGGNHSCDWRSPYSSISYQLQLIVSEVVKTCVLVDSSTYRTLLRVGQNSLKMRCCVTILCLPPGSETRPKPPQLLKPS